jgi:hypothetical protein
MRSAISRSHVNSCVIFDVRFWDGIVHERTTVPSEKGAAVRRTYIERNENAVPNDVPHSGKFVAIHSLISSLF